MKILVSLILLAQSFFVFAEIIDGPANLRVAPQGRVAVSLNDGVEVYVQRKEDNWFQIVFLAYVSKQDYQATRSIRGEVELYNYGGESIGRTVDSFSDIEYFEDSERYGLVITLYTYKSNIVESTILENKVVDLINSNELNRNSILNLEHLKIEKWSNVEGFSGGIVLNIPSNPYSQGIRFIFFVQNQEVVAIVGSDRMKDLDFECLGMTEIKEQRLNVFYLKEQAFSKRQAFEKSMLTALSRMH